MTRDAGPSTLLSYIPRITGPTRRQPSLVAKAGTRARPMGLVVHPAQDRTVRH
jgi:hypothetical protein